MQSVWAECIVMMNLTTKKGHTHLLVPTFVVAPLCSKMKRRSNHNNKETSNQALLDECRAHGRRLPLDLERIVEEYAAYHADEWWLVVRVSDRDWTSVLNAHDGKRRFRNGVDDPHEQRELGLQPKDILEEWMVAARALYKLLRLSHDTFLHSRASRPIEVSSTLDLSACRSSYAAPSASRKKKHGTITLSDDGIKPRVWWLSYRTTLDCVKRLVHCSQIDSHSNETEISRVLSIIPITDKNGVSAGNNSVLQGRIAVAYAKRNRQMVEHFDADWGANCRSMDPSLEPQHAEWHKLPWRCGLDRWSVRLEEHVLILSAQAFCNTSPKSSSPWSMMRGRKG